MELLLVRISIGTVGCYEYGGEEKKIVGSIVYQETSDTLNLDITVYIPFFFCFFFIISVLLSRVIMVLAEVINFRLSPLHFLPLSLLTLERIIYNT